MDVSEKTRVETAAQEKVARRERMSAAGGQLLATAFGFLAELVPPPTNAEEAKKTSATIREQLAQCLETDEQGRLRMSITLPDPAVIGAMAESLARLVAFAAASK